MDENHEQTYYHLTQASCFKKDEIDCFKELFSRNGKGDMMYNRMWTPSDGDGHGK